MYVLNVRQLTIWRTVMRFLCDFPGFHSTRKVQWRSMQDCWSPWPGLQIMVCLRKTSTTYVSLLCIALAVGQFMPAVQSATASGCGGKATKASSCCARRIAIATKAAAKRRSCCQPVEKAESKKRPVCSHCETTKPTVAAINVASIHRTGCCCQPKQPAPAVPARTQSPVRKSQTFEAVLSVTDDWQRQTDRGQEVASLHCDRTTHSPPLWLMHCAHLA
jgi:hypothetical protein